METGKKEKLLMAKNGRPTKYAETVATEICDRLSNGESLRAICTDSKMPSESCVRRWALDDREGFFAQYARARDIALDLMADEVIEIVDGPGDAADKRVRFDARRWYLSKLAPKRYGDRHQIEHSAIGGWHTSTATKDLTDDELLAIIQTSKD